MRRYHKIILSLHYIVKLLCLFQDNDMSLTHEKYQTKETTILFRVLLYYYTTSILGTLHIIC